MLLVGLLGWRGHAARLHSETRAGRIVATAGEPRAGLTESTDDRLGKISAAAAADQRTDVLLIPLFQPLPGEPLRLDSALDAIDTGLGGALTRLLATSGFSGVLGDSVAATLPDGAPFASVAALGLGPAASFSSPRDLHARWGALIATYARGGRTRHAAAVLPRADGRVGVPSAPLPPPDSPAPALLAQVPRPPALEEEAASLGPLDLLVGVSKVFTPSGAAAPWPFFGTGRGTSEAEAEAAKERGDREVSATIAALLRGDAEAAGAALAEARAAFGEAGGEAARGGGGVVESVAGCVEGGEGGGGGGGGRAVRVEEAAAA